MSIIDLKTKLRASLRARLATIDPAEAAEAAARAGARLLALPELDGASGAVVCRSFGVEIETRGVIDRLLARGVPVYLPRIAGRGGPMTLHRYPCRLERLRFGLEQPAAEVPAIGPAAPLDVAVILGLAFDAGGFRLGYGGGYFDRFLTGRRSVTAIGLGFETQMVDALPREPHDRPMAVLVSEASVRRPGA